MARPPAATAMSGGQSVPLGIGTYCWSEPPLGGLCVDSTGPVTGTQALAVSRGAQVVVVNPAPAMTIREVSVMHFPATGTPMNTNSGQVWNFPAVGGAQLSSNLSGGNVQFTADLPGGRYVVVIGLFYPQGDVQYGLLLEVR